VHEQHALRLLPVDGGAELRLPFPEEVTVLHARPEGVLLWLGIGHFRFVDPVEGWSRDFVIEPSTTPDYWAHRGLTFPPARDAQHVRIRDGYRLVDLDLGAPAAAPTAEQLDRSHKQIERLAALVAGEHGLPSARQTWSAVGDVRWPYHTDALPTLETILTSYRDSNVRRATAHHIGRSTDPAARSILVDALVSVDDFFVREGILAALSMIPGERATAAILDRSFEGGLIEDAALALGVLGDPAALPYLRDVAAVTFPLQSQTDDVQRAVSDAIRDIESREQVEQGLRELRVAGGGG